jgi:hypothetical protein
MEGSAYSSKGREQSTYGLIHEDGDDNKLTTIFLLSICYKAHQLFFLYRKNVSNNEQYNSLTLT